MSLSLKQLALSGDILIVLIWEEVGHPWCLVIKGQGCHSPYNGFLKTLPCIDSPPHQE